VTHDPETTSGGAPVYRHTERRELGPPEQFDEALATERRTHLERYLGPNPMILAERLSVGIFLDIYVFAPTPQAPHLTLVTSGMSDLPMAVPDGMEDIARLELLLALPTDWPGLAMDGPDGLEPGGAFEDERNYWPIRLLKDLARLPHDYDTYLSWGHSIPNGEPAEPYAPGVPFDGALIAPPLGYPPEMIGCPTSVGRVSYLAVLPLRPEEMAFKVDSPGGADPLIDRFEVAGVTALVDVGRPGVVDRG
jgi:Suppressor of fused protein (SUFU)